MSATTHLRGAQLKARLAGKSRGVDRAQRPVYLLGLHCYRPPEEWRILEEDTPKLNKYFQQELTPEAAAFVQKVAVNSGVAAHGQFFPPAVLDKARTGEQYRPTMALAREEAEDALFTSMTQLLEETGVDVKQIGVVVVNCSLFNPTPSLSAMVVNHFKLPSDVITYNLGGMGCSAGLLSLTLAQDVLQAHPNRLCVVLSMENITCNFYRGTERSMLIPNVLFRVGASAVLLSNRGRDRPRAKYELLHTVRTHLGADEEAYRCVFQQEDQDGVVGVRLDKKLMKVAGKALKKNMETLGLLCLPLSEQLRFLKDAKRRRKSAEYREAHPEPYVPDFTQAFSHFCIHAGGRGVLDAVQENLKLGDDRMQPSRETLANYGNTSSSSIWYELAWSEHHGRVRRGDKVWQIAFGSGFKCNSAVWKALRDVDTVHVAWSPGRADLSLEAAMARRTFKGSLPPAGEGNTREDDDPGEILGRAGTRIFSQTFTKRPWYHRIVPPAFALGGGDSASSGSTSGQKSP